MISKGVHYRSISAKTNCFTISNPGAITDNIGIKIFDLPRYSGQFVSVLFMYTPAAVFILVLNCQLSNCVWEYLQ